MSTLTLDVQDLVRLATPGCYKDRLAEIVEMTYKGEGTITYFRLLTELCRLAACWEQDMTPEERDACKQDLAVGLSSLVWTFEAMMLRERSRSGC